MPDSPFIRDVPAARALEAWQAARDAAGCPERLPAITVPVTEAAGLVTVNDPEDPRYKNTTDVASGGKEKTANLLDR